MRKPIDIENLTDCVKHTADGVKVYCVECDRWRSVAVTAMARVTFRLPWQVSKRNIDIDSDTVAFRCNSCNADIDYLFENDRVGLIDEMIKA